MYIMCSAWRLAITLVLPLGVAQGQAETGQVIIDKLVFTPGTINAKIDDTIEWVNKDAIAHTATVKGGWEVMISMPPPKRASQPSPIGASTASRSSSPMCGPGRAVFANSSGIANAIRK